MNATRIVCCLTAIPSRMPYLTKTVHSLLRQTLKADVIYLFLPQYSKKERCRYEPWPDEINQMVNEKHISIVRCQEDFGPITKLLPVLTTERSDPVHETLIINVDDDVMYSPRLFESLVDGWIRHPGCRIGIEGWIIGRGLSQWMHIGQRSRMRDVEIDVVEATFGSLYSLRDLLSVSRQLHSFEECREARWCDDMWTSGVLSAQGQRGYVVPLLDAHKKLRIATEAASINALRLGATEGDRVSRGPSLVGRLSMAKRNFKVVQHLRRHYQAFRMSIPYQEFGWSFQSNWCVSHCILSAVLLSLLLSFGTIFCVQRIRKENK